MEPENENGARKPIQPFLRKGQGTARFGMPNAPGRSTGPPVATNSPLIQLPRFTPTSSIPTSARTLDSGYSNEDETRPPTTASLPLDRQSNGNRTPMILEEEDEGHVEDDHEEEEEVSAQPTFFPDTVETGESEEGMSEHSSGARRFRQMAEEMHEQRKIIQTMNSVSLTPSSYASSDLSGPLGASTPIHGTHLDLQNHQNHLPTPPQPFQSLITEASLETPISSRPFASNRVNLMANEAQTGISLIQRHRNHQNHRNPVQTAPRNIQDPQNPQNQKENHLETISEHVYDQPILRNQGNSNQNHQNTSRANRNLMIQLRDAIAHLDYAEEQVRAAGRLMKQNFEKRKKELEEKHEKKQKEIEEEYEKKKELWEEETKMESERLARERRDIERDRKMLNKGTGEKYKEIEVQKKELKDKLTDSETRCAKLRQTIRTKEENEKKKDEELEKTKKESERWKRNAETLEKKVRELRAEKSKWEKEEELRVREQMKRIGDNRRHGMNLNQSLGAGGVAPRGRIVSDRKTSTGSAGSRRTVSFADVPEEHEIVYEHPEVFEQSFEPVMTPIERIQSEFGPCTIWKDQLGAFTKVTKTADDGRFFEYHTGEKAYFTASRAFSWTRRTNGTLVMHLSVPNIIITYFHNRQLEICRPNGNVTLISLNRSDIRTEVHRDSTTGEAYAQLFDRNSGKCTTIDYRGVKNSSYKSGDTCSYRDSQTRCVKIESSYDDFELIEPEFRLRWYKSLMFSMKILSRPQTGEKTLSLKCEMHDGSGWMEAVEAKRADGQHVKTSVFKWCGVAK